MAKAPTATAVGLVNGVHVLRHDTDRGRYYETPDGTFRSVTSILKDVIGKEALVNWAASMEREYAIEACADLYDDLPNGAPKMSRTAFMDTLKRRMSEVKAFVRKKDKAADIGSEVHKMIEYTLRSEIGIAGEEPRISPEAGHSFAQFVQWRAEHNLKIKGVEVLVWKGDEGPLPGWAGTMDLRCEIDGKDTVLDFKTSKYIYDEYFLQVEAYAQALEWMKQGQPKQLCIVRVPKEATQKFEVVTRERDADTCVSWVAAVKLSRWLNRATESRIGKVEFADAASL